MNDIIKDILIYIQKHKPLVLPIPPPALPIAAGIMIGYTYINRKQITKYYKQALSDMRKQSCEYAKGDSF